MADKERKNNRAKNKGNEKSWPLRTWAVGMYKGASRLCPFYWAIDRPSKGDTARAWWLIGWLIVLVVIWLHNPSGPFAIVCAGIALIRLVEIFTSGLGTVLARGEQLRVRDLETIAIYVFQLAFIFAICERALPVHAFSPTPHRPFDYLYISWTNLTSLGSSYTPTAILAKITQMVTTAFGLFLIGVLLALGINKIENK